MKTTGCKDTYETGITLSIATDSGGDTIVTVHSYGVIKRWWSEHVKVIK